MIKITFIHSDGGRIIADARKGMSVMEVAVQNKVPGIDADCGGACACATCHIYVMPDDSDRSGDRNRIEQDMLSFAVDVRQNSRLACQMPVTSALDGLVVIVPEKQF